MIFTIILSLFPVIIQVFSYDFFYNKINRKKKINIKLIILFWGSIMVISFLYSLFLLLPDYWKIFRDIFHYLFLLIQPLIFYKYFLIKRKEYDNYLNLFLSFVIYLSVETSETFFSVIISSITGDYFVKQHYDIFYIIINLLALFIILKVVDFFDFYFEYYKEPIYKNDLYNVNKSYIVIHILLNISHWFSENAHLNSFASMIATIGFIMFLSTLFYLKSAREQHEKAKEIQQKKEEQRQLQLYTDEIVGLYNEIRGFRHDYAGMLTSLQIGINSGDMKEVERIFHNVLSQANISLRSDDYTFFELNNVQDTALRSVLIQTIFKARECGVEIVFEMKDVIETLPMKLLDLVRVASVLLNNAVEGAAESPSKTMNVSLVKLDKEIVFVIQNSRQSRYINLEEIYEVGFSTKGENRGLGLNNVKEIIDKYDEVILETDIETNYFIQVVRFKRKEQI